MKTRSIITGKVYDSDNVWYVANIEQIDAYNSNGAESRVLDVLYNGRKNKFIFVYPKDEFMKRLYDLWCKHELKRSGGGLAYGTDETGVAAESAPD